MNKILLTTALLAIPTAAFAVNVGGFASDSGDFPISVNNGSVYIRAATITQDQASFSGGVQTGTDNGTCSTAKEGELRYNLSIQNIEFCNGLVWATLGSSSSGTLCGVFYSADYTQNGEGIYWSTSMPCMGAYASDFAPPNCPGSYSLIQIAPSTSANQAIQTSYACIKN